MNPAEFEYDGRTLEVRVVLDSQNWKISVFENGKRANGAVYSVSEQDAVDFKQTMGLDLVDELKKSAQNDFIRWSEWLKKDPESLSSPTK